MANQAKCSKQGNAIAYYSHKVLIQIGATKNSTSATTGVLGTIISFKKMLHLINQTYQILQKYTGGTNFYRWSVGKRLA